MENIFAGNILVKLNQTNGSRLCYRVVRAQHMIIFNIPHFRSKKSVLEEINRIIVESVVNGRFNDIRDGGYIVLFGEKVPLSITNGDKYKVKMENGVVHMELQNGKYGFTARKMMNVFYKKLLSEKLKKLVPRAESLTGIKCNNFTIHTVYSTWGKCNYEKKELTFSVELVTKSEECIYMVIVHELGHILYPNHQKEFQEYMKKYIPNLAYLNKELKM